MADTKQARYSRRKQSEIAEIGPIPPVKHPDRKALCKYDLALYSQAYFPYSAGLSPFSPEHYRALDTIQRAMLIGGLFLQIVFRGFAKSTIAEIATVWGVSYGHIKFPVPIGADSTAAAICLESIKTEFETNELLLEDFPEICHPIRCLEGKPQRCNSQTHNGERTHIEWTATHIVLPTIKDSPASGAIIKPKGITANLRGIRHKRTDGKQARPDFILLDDPQTDQAARSPDQVDKNLRVLNKAILRLGGHREKLSAVCNATIIEPDDMIDRLSDVEKFPAWQTMRVPMLKSFATEHEKLWLGSYAELRNTYNPEIANDQERARNEATAYYEKNRKKMDAGCEPTWLSCYEPDSEVSAVQHAYNILIDTGLEAFMAECQNDPIAQQADLEILTAAEIARKVNGFKRGEFPKACDTLTAFIDVQGALLYYAVAAWQQDYTGYIIDYGSWPDQKRTYYTARDARATLRRKYKGTDEEGAIFAGLTDCINHICGREWRRDDGATLRIRRCLVDANWGGTSTCVNNCCRQSPHAAVLTPSYGRGIKATHKPISQWQQSKGKNVGPEWVPTEAKGKQLVGVIYDTNYHKKLYHNALAQPLGNGGSISLFQASPTTHRMFADQAASEIPKKVDYDGRVVYEWDLKPGQDNHIGLDCAVGCRVAASLAGISVHTAKSKPKPKRKSRIV